MQRPRHAECPRCSRRSWSPYKAVRITSRKLTAVAIIGITAPPPASPAHLVGGKCEGASGLAESALLLNVGSKCGLTALPNCRPTCDATPGRISSTQLGLLI